MTNNIRNALKVFADLGVGSGPDHETETYQIERGAIRNARTALDSTQPAPADVEAVKRIKNIIDSHLDNALCEMKEGRDDSVTGFNEAWDNVREVFANHLSILTNASSETEGRR